MEDKYLKRLCKLPKMRMITIITRKFSQKIQVLALSIRDKYLNISEFLKILVSYNNINEPININIIENQKTLEDNAVDGMISIISKNQGWITVSPTNLDRKNPIEK